MCTKLDEMDVDQTSTPVGPQIQKKLFNDPIHGSIELHPLCVKIIDTVQFQRLRYLKQLGGCYFVYPGASHNRFEHSIGVCHLAGELVRALRSKLEQREEKSIEITKEDELCVEIAGLCHDLGHGPFSHMFESFVKRIHPDAKWSHEEASLQLFDYMIDNNDLEKAFEKYNLHDKRDFIKALIHEEKKDDKWKDKRFLFEIVANDVNGIDVDKWDYFARDSYMLGMKVAFDHLRLIKNADVLKHDGKWHICFRDKEVHNVCEMFHTRMTLHRRAYKHKKNWIIEDEITYALVSAKDLNLTKRDGTKVKLPEAVYDMEVYSKLTDEVFWKIMNSTDDGLTKARNKLEAILKRDLPIFISEKIINKDDNTSDKELQRSVEEHCKSECNAEALVVGVVVMGYGIKGQYPVEHVIFYDKDSKTSKQKKDEISRVLPTEYKDRYVRLYSRKKDDTTVSKLKDRFDSWEPNLRPGSSGKPSRPRNYIHHQMKK